MNGAMLLPEFDHETANTRKVLERVPEDRLDFKPHEKSFSLGHLAAHVANLLTWTGITLTTEKLDVSGPMEREEPKTNAELLALFDKNVAEARAALEGASEEDMGVDWSLTAGEQVYFTMPRVAVIRSFVMNHLIHHRAQLGVYLRLLDVPIPGMYGPSADEAM